MKNFNNYEFDEIPTFAEFEVEIWGRSSTNENQLQYVTKEGKICQYTRESNERDKNERMDYIRSFNASSEFIALYF